MRRARARFASSAAVCLLLALFASACGEPPRYAKSSGSDAQQQRPTAQPRTNLPMPSVVTARDVAQRAGGWTTLDGRREGVEDYRGRVLLLDFYATYCLPCRDEIPHLLALRRRFAQQGLEIVGLNVGGEVDQRKVPDYVADLGISYPLGNPDTTLVDALFAGDSAIPQTFVFDRQGRLVEHVTGFNPTIAAQLESAVEKALTSAE